MAILRAWRRVAACVLHALHGAAICAFEFPFLDLAGRRRRVSWWAARMLRVLDVRLDVQGTLQPAPVLLLANHVSWLDILAVHAVEAARFVSKADVRRWPLVGFLVAGGGTLFIEREKKRDALRVVHHVAEALRDGSSVAIFPEGTVGDGRALLPFHANLVQAAIVTGDPVQPVALRFSAPGAAFCEAVAYVGETTLLQSLWRIVTAEGLVAHVRLLPALPSAGRERRGLAAEARASIQAALDEAGARASSAVA